jgi:hypothetical protein
MFFTSTIEPSGYNNKKPEFDEYLVSLQTDKADSTTDSTATFRIQLSNIIGDPNIYNTNEIYLVPLFFYNSCSTAVTGSEHFCEVRLTGLGAMNQISRAFSNDVLLRLYGELHTAGGHNHYNYSYENLDNVNNKYLRVNTNILNGADFQVSLHNQQGAELDILGSDNGASDRRFTLMFKIVLFRK